MTRNKFVQPNNLKLKKKKKIDRIGKDRKLQ